MAPNLDPKLPDNAPDKHQGEGGKGANILLLLLAMGLPEIGVCLSYAGHNLALLVALS